MNYPRTVVFFLSFVRKPLSPTWDTCSFFYQWKQTHDHYWRLIWRLFNRKQSLNVYKTHCATEQQTTEFSIDRLTFHWDNFWKRLAHQNESRRHTAAAESGWLVTQSLTMSMSLNSLSRIKFKVPKIKLVSTWLSRHWTSIIPCTSKVELLTSNNSIFPLWKQRRFLPAKFKKNLKTTKRTSLKFNRSYQERG